MPAYKKKHVKKRAPSTLRPPMLPYSIDFLCMTPTYRRRAITSEVKRVGAERVSRRLWSLWKRWKQGWPPRGALKMLAADIDWFEGKYGWYGDPWHGVMSVPRAR